MSLTSVLISALSNFQGTSETQTDGSSICPTFAFPYGNRVISSELTKTAPTTQYNQGAIIGGAANGFMTFAGISPRLPSVLCYLNGLMLFTDLKTCNWQVRVHIYNANPTAIADYAAFSYIYADTDKYQGYVDLPPMAPSIDTTNSTASFSQAIGISVPFISSSTNNITMIMENRTVAGLAPANGQKFKLIGYFA